jgi:hypothetical protein
VNALKLAALKMVAAQAFQQVRESPEDVKRWGPVVKLLVNNDRNETVREEQQLKRELRAEDHKIRREALDFARENINST